MTTDITSPISDDIMYLSDHYRVVTYPTKTQEWETSIYKYGEHGYIICYSVWANRVDSMDLAFKMHIHTLDHISEVVY